MIPLPVTTNDPLMTAAPTNGNVVAVTPVNPDPSPLNDPVKEPVNGSLSVVNCVELEITPAGNVAVAFSAYDAVAGIKVMDVAADAVVANELLTTLLAQLLVPNNELVIPPFVTVILPDNILSDPVIVDGPTVV